VIVQSVLTICMSGQSIHNQTARRCRGVEIPCAIPQMRRPVAVKAISTRQSRARLPNGVVTTQYGSVAPVVPGGVTATVNEGGRKPIQK
jgi:hypothetical protein